MQESGNLQDKLTQAIRPKVTPLVMLCLTLRVAHARLRAVMVPSMKSLRIRLARHCGALNYLHRLQSSAIEDGGNELRQQQQ